MFHGNNTRAFYCDTIAKAVKILKAGTIDKGLASYELFGMQVGEEIEDSGEKATFVFGNYSIFSSFSRIIKI